MRRIHVCGTSGSGKTTLARELSRILAADHVELDALWHGPNWTTIPVDDFRALVADAAKGERWVMDGNYSKVRDLIWSRVDLVVWLDYPLPLILRRLTRRTFGRWARREVLWHGNREHLWRHLLVPKDSLYWWVLTTYRRRKREFQQLSRDPACAHIVFKCFRSPRDAETWVQELGRCSHPQPPPSVSGRASRAGEAEAEKPRDGA